MTESKCSLVRDAHHLSGVNLGERLLCLLHSGDEDVGDVTLVSSVDSSTRRGHKDVLRLAFSLDSLELTSRNSITLPVRGRHIDLLIELFYTGKVNNIEDSDVLLLYLAAQKLKLDDIVRQLKRFMETYLVRYCTNDAFFDLTFDELTSLVPILADVAHSPETRLRIVQQIFEWTGKHGTPTFEICRSVLNPKAEVEELLMIYPALESREFHVFDVASGEEKAVLKSPDLDHPSKIVGLIDGSVIIYKTGKGSPDLEWQLTTCDYRMHKMVQFVSTDGIVTRSIRSGSFNGMVLFKRQIFCWTKRDVYVMQDVGWRRVAHLDMSIAGRLIIKSYSGDELVFAFVGDHNTPTSYLAHATPKGVHCVLFNASALGFSSDDLLVKTTEHLLAVTDNQGSMTTISPLFPDPLCVEEHKGHLYALRRGRTNGVKVFRTDGLTRSFRETDLVFPFTAYFVRSIRGETA